MAQGNYNGRGGRSGRNNQGNSNQNRHAGYQLYGGDKRGLYNKTAYTATGRHSRNPMIYRKQPKKWPKFLLALAVVLIVLFGLVQFACGGLPFLKGEDKQQEQEVQQVEEKQPTAEELTRTDANGKYVAGLDTSFTITAVGDCTLGTDPSFDYSTSLNAKFEDVSPDYFFANVLPFTGSDQMTIANFEGTLTESTDIQEKTFRFKGPASFSSILTQGSVEVANIANNHSFDYGQQGIDDTRANLSAASIPNFGYDRTATYEVNGIKIGLFGICQLDGVEKSATLTQQNIKSLQDEGCQLIVGVFHWGIEGENVPVSESVDLAHLAIDSGCDLVIGGHPHVLQGVEYYKNRYICYSMGNFCFGGNTHPGDFDTMMYQQTFTFKDGQLVMDDTTSKQAYVIPCSVSSSSSINNYQPTPLTGDEGTRVINKLNGFSSQLAGQSVSFNSALGEDGRAEVSK